ncbi:MAG: type II toxin-antitoxin system HicA family toxin [Elusimicrobiota bacterium]
MRALHKNSFTFVRQTGSHYFVEKMVNNQRVVIPIPIHGSKIIKLGLLHGILRKTKITPEKLKEFL